MPTAAGPDERCAIGHRWAPPGGRWGSRKRRTCAREFPCPPALSTARRCLPPGCRGRALRLWSGRFHARDARRAEITPRWRFFPPWHAAASRWAAGVRRTECLQRRPAPRLPHRLKRWFRCSSWLSILWRHPPASKVSPPISRLAGRGQALARCHLRFSRRTARINCGAGNLVRGRLSGGSLAPWTNRVPGGGRLQALPRGDPGQGWLPHNLCGMVPGRKVSDIVL